jgi:hypothetical protein
LLSYVPYCWKQVLLRNSSIRFGAKITIRMASGAETIMPT